MVRRALELWESRVRPGLALVSSSALFVSFACVAATSGTGDETGSSGPSTDSSDGASERSGDDAGDLDSESDTEGSDEESGDDSETGLSEACNGYVELCSRPYNEVAFPGTHNANAATSYGYSAFNANHDTGLTQQLEAGVRVMLIDVTYDEGETTLCHGPCNLGSMPHLEGLAELHDFLIDHPREVLTIIYQDSISVRDMQSDFETSGLIDLVYAHVDGEPWPTLGEMIDGGTRLVVTAEAGGPPPAWYHHVWDVGWDTGYSWTSTAEMTCDLNRGSTDNDLFLVNHWVNTVLGTPSKADAAASNSLETLSARLAQCQDESGRIPNFVAVDFYEAGDLFEAVADLNGL